MAGTIVAGGKTNEIDMMVRSAKPKPENPLIIPARKTQMDAKTKVPGILVVRSDDTSKKSWQMRL